MGVIFFYKMYSYQRHVFILLFSVQPDYGVRRVVFVHILQISIELPTLGLRKSITTIIIRYCFSSFKG